MATACFTKQYEQELKGLPFFFLLRLKWFRYLSYPLVRSGRLEGANICFVCLNRKLGIILVI
jgi:hypothetical protein